MKAFKTIGLVGLAITTVLNLVALLLFKRASAEYFSDPWWSAWFPSYIIWLSFTLIGFAGHGRPNLGAGRSKRFGANAAALAGSAGAVGVPAVVHEPGGAK